MNNTHKTIALAIGGAFALSIAATSVNAADNPFAVKALSSGYQVADNHTGKMKDGKCATGKCGANKKVAMEKEMMEKNKEGKCSADKAVMEKGSMEKAKEGACSAEKMKEGACSAEMKKNMTDKTK